MDADPAQEFSVDPGTDREFHRKDWKMAAEAIAFMQARKPGDRPFFISLNPGLVHASFRTNRHWLDRIPAELVDAPPLDPCAHPCEVYQRKSKGWRHGFDDATVKTVRRSLGESKETRPENSGVKPNRHGTPAHSGAIRYFPLEIIDIHRLILQLVSNGGNHRLRTSCKLHSA